jgi:hypothetical protein
MEGGELPLNPLRHCQYTEVIGLYGFHQKSALRLSGAGADLSGLPAAAGSSFIRPGQFQPRGTAAGPGADLRKADRRQGFALGRAEKSVIGSRLPGKRPGGSRPRPGTGGVLAVLLQLLSSVGRCLFCPRIKYSRKRPRKDRLIPPGPSSERYSLRGPEGRAGLQPPPKALRMNVRPGPGCIGPAPPGSGSSRSRQGRCHKQAPVLGGGVLAQGREGVKLAGGDSPQGKAPAFPTTGTGGRSPVRLP